MNAPDMDSVYACRPGFVGVGWTVMSLGVLLVAWASMVETDVVAVASGHIRPMASVRTVQSMEPGTVLKLLVQEGDQVKEGQVLLALDAQQAVTDLLAAQRALVANLAMAAELNRVAAEADADAQAESRVPADVPLAIWREAERHAASEMRARREAQHDLRREASARWIQADAEWRTAVRDEQRLASLAGAGQQQLSAFAQLHADGFISQLSMAERQRDQAARNDEEAAQRARVGALLASRDAARVRLDALRSEFQSRAATELQSLRAQEPQLVQALAHAQARRRRLELVAPMDGVVKDLLVSGPGQVVASGTTVMSVVPASVALKAEVWLGHEDIGQVEVGQAARVKLAAFPFQRHGWLDGRVTRLAPDVSMAQADGTERGFRAEVQLAQPRGEGLPMRAGMAVQAEIVLARRTLLSYLLSPVLAVSHDAAQER